MGGDKYSSVAVQPIDWAYFYYFPIAWVSDVGQGNKILTY